MRSMFVKCLFAIMLLTVAAYSIQEEKGDFPKPCSPESWVKHGIALEPTEAWEGNIVSIGFASPPEPLGDGRWRIWYRVVNPEYTIAVAEGIPGGKMIKHKAVLTAGEPADAPLAIGNLPKGWMPAQPVHIKLKDGRDRLYFWVHSSKHHVVRYLAADSNDGRRYRVIDPHQACIYHFHDRAVEFVGTTTSGLKLKAKSKSYLPANEPAATPELITNDATTVYQLPDGSFELYTATMVSLGPGDPRWANNDNCPGMIRVIDRLISKDGLHWSGRQRVLEPDANDPIDQQFYYLSVTHTPKGRVGMLGHYRLYAQTMDLEWCFSKDGVNWVRPFRKPWLERSQPYESVDSFSIYPSGSLVFDNDKWWLFYTGGNRAHNGKCSYGKPTGAVMLATTESIWKEP
ncbi:MAG: hypothetical protein JXB29_04900 [Sedimentisphaerales bacterium]|nr:hypothetical protein [Sedimentisphaerales bacterium]